MLRRPTKQPALAQWQRKLTAAQRKHLRDNDMRTLADVKLTLAAQAVTRASATEPQMEPCWDCLHIARRLDLPT